MRKIYPGSKKHILGSKIHVHEYRKLSESMAGKLVELHIVLYATLHDMHKKALEILLKVHIFPSKTIFKL